MSDHAHLPGATWCYLYDEPINAYPAPVPEWQNCESCGHDAGACDCGCCYPEWDDQHEEAPDVV